MLSCTGRKPRQVIHSGALIASSFTSLWPQLAKVLPAEITDEEALNTEAEHFSISAQPIFYPRHHAIWTNVSLAIPGRSSYALALAFFSVTLPVAQPTWSAFAAEHPP